MHLSMCIDFQNWPGSLGVISYCYVGNMQPRMLSSMDSTLKLGCRESHLRE